LKTLEDFIKTTQDDDSVMTYDFDHVSGNRAALQVILYAELGTKEFVEAHKILSAKAQNDEIKYIFRHSMTEETVKKLGNLNLQGYGVELALKNVEYKVIDDSNKEQTNEPEQKQEEPAKEEDNTPVGGNVKSLVTIVNQPCAGFDFAILKKRYPDLSVELAQFRSSMTHDDETDFAQLKSAELKDMAIKASQKIIDSQEPLHVLRDIASNLPSLAKSIIKQPAVTAPHKSIKNNMINLGVVCCSYMIWSNTYFCCVIRIPTFS
jgi:UDP-glucose:glycoprotein glucosyltransferase